MNIPISRSLLFLGAMAFLSFETHARPISGTALYHLNSPATKQITEKTAAIASRNFRVDCVEWIKEETGTTLDSANAIWNFHLSAFTDSCLRIARQETSFKDREFQVAITLSDEQARATLQAYNSHCHSISLSTWTRLKKLLESNINSSVFQLGIQTIFYGMGRIEKTVDVPGENEPGFFLLDDARKIVQDFINRITIHSQTVVISGKPGDNADSYIILEVTLDTLQLADFDLLGKIAPGKKMFSGKTASNGMLTIKDFKIPYVAKGTLLYVESDFGAAVNNICSFSANDLGLKFPDQTILFNTVPPTYVLNYKAAAVNKIDIPRDFASDVFIKKFLHDSCHVTPAADADKADLYIDITSQVSSYSSDSTEKTVLKVENAIAIRNTAGNTLAEKTAIAHEKAYENAMTIPFGLFFWEAAGKSTAMIKAIFSGM
jgi:hypothetical protein